MGLACSSPSVAPGRHGPLALAVELEPGEDPDTSDERQAAFDRTLRESRAPGASGDTLKAPPPWELSPN